MPIDGVILQIQSKILKLFDETRKPLVRGAIISIGLMGLGTVVGYLSQIFISRTVGVSEFGIYTYTLGLMNLVRTVVSFDLDIAAVRYVSIYNGKSDWSLFRGFVSRSRRFVVIISTLAAGVCVLLALLFRKRLEPGLFHAIVAACVLLVPASWLNLEVSLLQALRSVYGARVPNQLIRPIVLLGALYLLIKFMQFPATGSTAIMANVAAALVALFATFAITQQTTPKAVRSASAKTQLGEWARFCSLNITGSLVYLILSQQGDIVIVGSLVGTKESGLYAAASQISSLSFIGVAAVNQYTAPWLSQLHSVRSEAKLRTLLSRVMLLNSAVSVPIIAVLIVYGPLVLKTFGAVFVAAYPVIVILVIGNLVNAIWGGLWGDLLTMTGFQTESMILVSIVTAINLALTLILTPRFGIVGAALATTIAVVIRSVLLAFVIQKRLHFWPWTVFAPLRA